MSGISTSPACSIESCDRPVQARGYCQAHYRRWHQGRDMYAPLRYPELVEAAMSGRAQLRLVAS